MLPISDRLKEARIKLGLTQTEAAEGCNMVQRDISRLENGKAQFIPIPYIQFLHNKGVNLNWLYSDKIDNDLPFWDTENNVEENVEVNVEGISKNPLESYTKSIYTKGEKEVPPTLPPTLPPNHKNPLESYIKKGYPMKEPILVTVDNLGHDNIAYVPVKAQAGYLTGYKDKEYFEKLPAFALPGFKNDVYRAFEVSGYSMLPAEGVGLYPGDIIIAAFLDHPHKIRDSRVYVIVCEAPEVDNIIVKRCLNRLEANNKIICISDNKNGDYPAIILETEQIKEVWEFKAKISRHIPPPGSIFDQLNDLSGRLVIVEEKLKQNKLNKYHNSNDD